MPGMESIEATAESTLYNGGSLWAEYWTRTIIELRDRLIASGELDDRSIDTFLGQRADREWWTQTIALTTVHARAPSDRMTSRRPQDVDARPSALQAMGAAGFEPATSRV
jgi:hypothetical protein